MQCADGENRKESRRWIEEEGMQRIYGDDLPWTNGIKGKCDGRIVHGVGES